MVEHRYADGDRTRFAQALRVRLRYVLERWAVVLAALLCVAFWVVAVMAAIAIERR